MVSSKPSLKGIGIFSGDTSLYGVISGCDANNKDGEAISAGMYIYVIQAGTFKQTKKMMLLK